MNRNRHLYAGGIALALAILVMSIASRDVAGQRPAVAIDADDIGGVVTGPRGPEAGVWVIAETTRPADALHQDRRHRRSGPLPLPDLPKANYNVWVRGYGLVDSPKIQATPGKTLNLTAVPAPNARAAARVLPGAVLAVAAAACRARATSPAPGRTGNGISPNIKSQGEWIRSVINTDGCTGCHQIGQQGDARDPDEPGHVRLVQRAAWDRRIQSGQAGGGMSSRFTQVGRPRALAMYADWTDRIAAGELPRRRRRGRRAWSATSSSRMWDWADPKAYLHDEIASDKRNPTRERQRADLWRARGERRLHAGRGSGEAHGDAGEAAGARSEDAERGARRRRRRRRRTGARRRSGPARRTRTASRWTRQAACGSRRASGRNETSAFCRQGSTHPSAQAFPINQSGRQMQMYDPKTKRSRPSTPASARTI